MLSASGFLKKRKQIIESLNAYEFLKRRKKKKGFRYKGKNK
jgi:hypothetical protein